MTRVQSKFLEKVVKGASVFVGTALLVYGFYLMFLYLGYDNEQASGLAFITTIGGSIIYLAVGMAWQQAKYEVEEETRRVEQALKGKL